MTKQLALESLIENPSVPIPKGSRAHTRYLGSKARIAENILEIIGSPNSNSGKFVDAFSGTGVVSRQAALKGWEIIANDHLVSASINTTAQLLSKEDVPFWSFGGDYPTVLEELSQSDSISGFITQEYTPAGENSSHRQRQYFTPENGRKIDGIRRTIEDWHKAGKLTTAEKSLLIADLLRSANTVANIAGTYGCFLRHWNCNALRPLQLVPRTLLPESHSFLVLNNDVFTLDCTPQDVVYLDPPYTKRQYAAYYHILETIAIGDSPKVEGITGLRPWKEKSSPFCYKTQVVHALECLIQRLPAKQIFMSYSSEGHMALNTVETVFKQHGTLKIHTIDSIGRYRPNSGASAAGANVTEYLIELLK